MKIGIFGGTFDPIHLGHIIAAEMVRDRFQIDRMYLVPAFLPPHKHRPDIISPIHRFAMVKLAVEGNPGLAPSDFEIARQGNSYTVHTVEHFRSEGEIYLIMGHDSFSIFETWRRYEDILAMCRIVLPIRPGFDPVDWSRFGAEITRYRTEGRIIDVHWDKENRESECMDWKIALVGIPGLDVSSTEIRSRVASGRSVRYLLHDSVVEYIDTHGIYRRQGLNGSK